MIPCCSSSHPFIKVLFTQHNLIFYCHLPLLPVTQQYWTLQWRRGTHSTEMCRVCSLTLKGAKKEKGKDGAKWKRTHGKERASRGFRGVCLFWPCLEAWGILVPWLGVEPMSLQWKCRVSITGSAGKSLLEVSQKAWWVQAQGSPWDASEPSRNTINAPTDG